VASAKAGSATTLDDDPRAHEIDSELAALKRELGQA